MEKSEVKLKTEYPSDNVDVAMGEYFETDVKSEDNFDVQLESKELKHDFLSDSDEEGMTEYIETDIMMLSLKSAITIQCSDISGFAWFSSMSSCHVINLLLNLITHCRLVINNKE